MATRRGPGRAAAAAVALLILLSPLPPALAAPTPDYPSWEDVERAKADAAAAEREAARLESFLDDLEAEAMRLGRDAQIRAEESLIAQGELEEAAERAGRLADEVVVAREQAIASARLATQALVELSRAGGGDPTLALLTAPSSATGDLLKALSSAARLSERSQAMLDRAIADRNLADSLAEQSAVAEELHAEAADVAQERADAALRTVEAVATRVAAQQDDLDRMYEQLAALRGTTAELERQHREGRESPPGPVDPGPTASPTPTGNPSPTASPTPTTSPSPTASPSPTNSPSPSPSPSTPTVPPPNTGKAASAINYARAQLGKPYVLGGAGPHGWDCSGLTMMSYASVGVAIGGHGSTSQYNAMRNAGKLIPYGERQPGDLLFYSDGGYASAAVKYHVAMYIGGGQMIEAPYPGQKVRIVAVRSFDLVPMVARPTA